MLEAEVVQDLVDVEPALFQQFGGYNMLTRVSPQFPVTPGVVITLQSYPELLQVADTRGSPGRFKGELDGWDELGQ